VDAIISRLCERNGLGRGDVVVMAGEAAETEMGERPIIDSADGVYLLACETADGDACGLRFEGAAVVADLRDDAASDLAKAAAAAVLDPTARADRVEVQCTSRTFDPVADRSVTVVHTTAEGVDACIVLTVERWTMALATARGV
jgi:hypothetical protein